jgi:hypothetical protein
LVGHGTRNVHDWPLRICPALADTLTADSNVLVAVTVLTGVELTALTTDCVLAAAAVLTGCVFTAALAKATRLISLSLPITAVTVVTADNVAIALAVLTAV